MATPSTARLTWLCPDQAARERMLDMDERLRPPRVVAFAVLALAVFSTVPQEGWWPVALALVAFASFGVMPVLQRRVPAPEYALLGSWAFAQAVIAAAVALTGGTESFAVSWLAVPIVTLPARFGMRGLGAGVAFTAVLLLIVTLLVEPGDPGHQIYGVIFPMAGLIAIALLSIALMRSDVDHRTESVIDGLTGLLNRRALGHRLQELQAQAALTGNPVAVIAGDIDRFKTINDVHGHAMGDAVLVDVAYRLRKELRAFDLAYRIGGEEFLILLPGATIDDATDIAEELRARISEEPVCGLDVTISFGVSGSIDGTFDRDHTIAGADDALYKAKAGGRDQVVSAGREPALVG
jgi:diguanylate cyclase (GGDEF)-like protein